MIPGEGGGTGGAYAMSGPGDARDRSGYFTGTGRWTGGACAVSGPGGIRDPPGYFTGTRLTS